MATLHAFFFYSSLQMLLLEHSGSVRRCGAWPTFHYLPAGGSPARLKGRVEYQQGTRLQEITISIL